MSSTDSQVASSNELSVIFGILSTFLAILSILNGIYQSRLLSRTSIGGQDIEKQTPPPPKRVGSSTSFVSISSNASYEAYLLPTKVIKAPPPTYSGTSTKVQRRINYPEDIMDHQNLYARFGGRGILSHCWEYYKSRGLVNGRRGSDFHTDERQLYAWCT